MKILFSMRHSGAIRNFESALRMLAARGHRIHLSFVMRDKIGDDRMAVGAESVVTRLASEHPQISYGRMPKRSGTIWFNFARAVRFIADSLRYRLPAYEDADWLRDRAEERLPTPVRWVVRGPWFGWNWFNLLATRALVLIDRAIPIDSNIEQDVVKHEPDVVLVTPLVDLGSDQVDYVKSAHSHGIPSALCVHSWDNLTNKGVLRFVPDRIFVWNEAQRREAITHHGAAESAVAVTGAHTYDHWFKWQPNRCNDEFKREVGLDPSKPYVLYVGSSRFIAPDEINYVERWLTALRSSRAPELQQIGVLIRPHPENPQPWERLDKRRLGKVTVWPPGGANPMVDEMRADYFDSIFHSRAIVGINTSAMIEAGIVGRPSLTILDSEYEGSQRGTLHFHHLVNVGDGLIHVAEDFEDHLEQLRGYFLDGELAALKGRQFVAEFVRPHGMEVPATDILVEHVESLGSMGRGHTQRSPLWLQVLRSSVYPVAAIMHLYQLLSRRRQKQQRGMRTSSLWRWLLSAPRKLVLRILLRSLRLRRIRSFVNRYVVPRVMSAETMIPEMAMTEREIRRLNASGKPILVGPWLSEVGFEVLYWIPFLSWVREFQDFDPDRFVVASRGGVSQWYRGVTDNYIEVLDHMTTEHYLFNNLRRVQRGKQKQRKLTEFDTEVVRLAKDVTNKKDFEILHPSLMYNLFMPYWKRQCSLRLVDQFTKFKRHVAPEIGTLPEGLPQDYVAVRFYFNDSFPDTKSNRKFAIRMVQRLARHTDVVLLNLGFSMDEHRDLDPIANPRVHTVDHMMQPANNLGVQTAIISRARTFLGTYGGLSYLAPFYGVDSLVFYSDSRGFHDHHLEFAEYVFRELDGGRFIALDVGDTSLLQLAFGFEGKQIDDTP